MDKHKFLYFIKLLLDYPIISQFNPYFVANNNQKHIHPSTPNQKSQPQTIIINYTQKKQVEMQLQNQLKQLIIQNSPQIESLRSRAINGNKEYLKHFCDAICYLLKDINNHHHAYRQINQLLLCAKPQVIQYVDDHVMTMVAQQHCRDDLEGYVMWWRKIGERQEQKGIYPNIGDKLNQVQIKSSNSNLEETMAQFYSQFQRKSKEIMNPYVQFFSDSSNSVSNSNSAPISIQQASSETIQAQMHQISKIRSKIQTEYVSKENAQQYLNDAKKFLSLKPKSLRKELSQQYNGDRIWAKQFLENYKIQGNGQRISVFGYTAPNAAYQLQQSMKGTIQQMSYTNPQAYSPSRYLAPPANEYSAALTNPSQTRMSRESIELNTGVNGVSAAGNKIYSGTYSYSNPIETGVQGNRVVRNSQNNQKYENIGGSRHYHTNRDNSFGNYYHNGSFGAGDQAASLHKSRKGQLDSPNTPKQPDNIQLNIGGTSMKKSGRFDSFKQQQPIQPHNIELPNFILNQQQIPVHFQPTPSSPTAFMMKRPLTFGQSPQYQPNKRSNAVSYPIADSTNSFPQTHHQAQNSLNVHQNNISQEDPRQRPLSTGTYYSQTVPYDYRNFNGPNNNAGVVHSYDSYGIQDQKSPASNPQTITNNSRANQNMNPVETNRLINSNSSSKRRPKIFGNKSRQNMQQPQEDNIPIFIHGGRVENAKNSRQGNISEDKRSRSYEGSARGLKILPHNYDSSRTQPYNQYQLPINIQQIGYNINPSPRQTFLSDRTPQSLSDQDVVPYNGNYKKSSVINENKNKNYVYETGQFRQKEYYSDNYMRGSYTTNKPAKNLYYDGANNQKSERSVKKLSQFKKQKQARKRQLIGQKIPPPQPFLLEPYQSPFIQKSEFIRYRKNCLKQNFVLYSSPYIKIQVLIQRQSQRKCKLYFVYTNLTQSNLSLQTLYTIPKCMKVQKYNKIQRCFILPSQVKHQFALELVSFPLELCYLWLKYERQGCIGLGGDNITIPLPLTIKNYIQFLVIREAQWKQKWSEWMSCNNHHIIRHLTADPQILQNNLQNLLPEFISLSTTQNFSTEQIGALCNQSNMNNLKYLIKIAQRVQKIVTIQVLANRKVEDQDEVDFLDYCIGMWVVLLAKVQLDGTQ